MDFIEGLPKSEGRDNIMVMVDRVTRFAQFIGLAHPYIAKEIARVFMDRVVSQHGALGTIVSDRDMVFTSHFWKEFMGSMGIKLNMSTAYHPQTDGGLTKC